MFQSSNSWWVFYIGSLIDHIALSKQSLSGCVKCIAQGVMRGYQSSCGKGLLCSWPELEILHSPGDFNQYRKKESCSSCSSCLMFYYEWAVLVGCIKVPSIISVPFLVCQTLFHMLVLLSIAILPPRTHSIALFQNLLGCLVPA